MSRHGELRAADDEGRTGPVCLARATGLARGGGAARTAARPEPQRGRCGGRHRGHLAITLALILLYVFAQVLLAAWAGRGAKSDDDYLVAGRSLGTFAVAMSLFATWFASESLIATSSEVASDGLSGARTEPQPEARS